MRQTLLICAVVALYVLHQDYWFWDDVRPLVFGFVPIGLFYHGCFAVACALLMWLLVTFAWPARLERDAEEHQTTQTNGGQSR
jgi:hypothetical protein